MQKASKNKDFDWQSAIDSLNKIDLSITYNRAELRMVIYNDAGNIAFFETDHLGQIFYLQNAKTNEEILGLHEDIGGVIKLLKKHKWI